MKGKRRRRQTQFFAYGTGIYSVLTRFNQQAIDGQAGFMPKGSEEFRSVQCFHISNNIELSLQTHYNFARFAILQKVTMLESNVMALRIDAHDGVTRKQPKP